MDTKKLKEEIKLLERKLELLEQINRLQAIPAYPVYPSYPIYPAYPQPIYPWDRVIYSGGTTTIPCETITAHNGPATSDSTMIKEGDQVSYTN
jgi:hypothetical protein